MTVIHKTGGVPSNRRFASSGPMFLVARLAKSFSVRYFSYRTSRVCTLRTWRAFRGMHQCINYVRKLFTLRWVNRIAVRRAAKSQWSGFSTSTLPHLNFRVNTPLRSSGGPRRNTDLRTVGLSGETGVSVTGLEGPVASSRAEKLDSGEAGCGRLTRGADACSGAISAKGSNVERSVLETR